MLNNGNQKGMMIIIYVGYQLHVEHICTQISTLFWGELI